MIDDDRRCAVYRHYSALGQLLYVGRSFDPDQRWEALQRTETWTHLASRRVDHWLDDLAQAKIVERLAIRLENPVFNVQGRRGRPRYQWSLEQLVAMPDGTNVQCVYAPEPGGGWLVGATGIARGLANLRVLREIHAEVAAHYRRAG